MVSVRYHGVPLATKPRGVPARRGRARSRHPELSPCARRRRGSARDHRPGVDRAWANEALLAVVERPGCPVIASLSKTDGIVSGS